MQEHTAVPIERRARARWDQLSVLTGVSVGRKQTGWDHLTQVVLNDPTIRLKSTNRLETIVNLCRMLSRLPEPQFIALALRLGLTVDDQTMVPQSRQEVSERLHLSVSRIAQLEREAIEDLRMRTATEFPGMPNHVHHVASDAADKL